jgi:hypothetical protein
MSPDRTAFAFGVIALALAGFGFWAAYGQIDWRVAGLMVPIALVVIGAGMLLLHQPKN